MATNIVHDPTPNDPELSFFDRDRELSALDTAWNTTGAQLVALWGRRRVGKSTLLSHFAAAKRAVYLYGTRMAEREVLFMAGARLRSRYTHSIIMTRHPSSRI